MILTYEQWLLAEYGLKSYQFQEISNEKQDVLLHRYLAYRSEEDEQNTSDSASE